MAEPDSTAPSTLTSQHLTKSKLEETPDGTPYIALQTRSPTPIFLTTLQTRDAPESYALLSIDSVNDRMMSLPKPYTLENAVEWNARVLSGNGDMQPLHCLRADNPATGPFIGMCGLTPRGNNTAEVGYYLHPSRHGQSIMRAAARALVTWGFEHKGLEMVYVRVSESNAASRAVVSGIPEFVAQEEYTWEQWPENKGGEKKKLHKWIWRKDA